MKLNRKFCDSTVENLLELAKDTNLTFDWNCPNAVRFDAYFMIEDNHVTWSHYRSIGAMSGRNLNKRLERIVLNSEKEWVLCPQNLKTGGRRGEENTRGLNGWRETTVIAKYLLRGRLEKKSVSRSRKKKSDTMWCTNGETDSILTTSSKFPSGSLF